ncbi:Ribosomal protein L33, partial [gut metagenome]
LSDKQMEVYELRVNIQLECTECKRRNYSTSKNKRTLLKD